MRRMQIKEMAERLGITPRAIRYYEEKGLIAPPKEPDNRYRTFSEEEAWRLQTIVTLRRIGMPVSEIKKVLAEVDRGHEHVVTRYLELQRAATFTEWVRLKHQLEIIEQMIQNGEQNSAPSWDDWYRLTRHWQEREQWRLKWRDLWAFDQQAETFDQRVERNDPLDLYAEYDHALQTLTEWIDARPGETGLDLGAGTGNLAGRFFANGIRMAAVEQSAEMLRRCREKFPAMTTKLGNFLAIPFPDDAFDFIVTSFAFHHLREEQKPLALEEMHRVLRPGGRIGIVDWMIESNETFHAWKEKIRRAGRTDVLKEMASEYYVHLEWLCQWWISRGYDVQYRSLTPMLHVWMARPRDDVRRIP